MVDMVLCGNSRVVVGGPARGWLRDTIVPLPRVASCSV